MSDPSPTSEASPEVGPDPSQAPEALSCLRCGYSLIGQRGASVTCPECGATMRVEDIARQRAWSLMNLLRAPSWAGFAATAVVLTAVIAETPIEWLVALAVIGLGIWASLVRQCVRRMGSAQALGFVLAYHVVLFGQGAALILGLSFAAASITGEAERLGLLGFGLLVFAGGTFWMDRWISRLLRRRELDAVRRARARRLGRQRLT